MDWNWPASGSVLQKHRRGARLLLLSLCAEGVLMKEVVISIGHSIFRF